METASSALFEPSAAGLSPSVLRAGSTRAEITFAIGQTSLGSLLVARTERGVCAVFLGDDPQALTSELQDGFPKAEFISGYAGLEPLIAKTAGFIESPKLGLDVPLDLQGTAFQKRVWQALRDIPAGVTVSYSEIARRIGAPKSVRAVAGACAANKIALAIPCHRVVRNDGALSGYRWGVERKRALLRRESKA